MARDFITAYEKRLQDLERNFQNMSRRGQVTEVKFDKEKKRWYVKMADGEGDDAFKSDWLPWKSMSHGSIRLSVPPRKGQLVEMRSPGGTPEMACCEPWHYNPENPSPHDKEDEIFLTVQAPEDKDENKDGDKGSEGGSGASANARAASTDGGDKQSKEDQQLKLHLTKDGMSVWLGKTKVELTAKGLKFSQGDNSWNLTADGIKQLVGEVEVNLTKAGEEQTKGYKKHDKRNIGSDHIHGGVEKGGAKTDAPEE
ncbi:phage baseplate assembly protein V [Methylobacterium indicum]|uniref:Gp5/Type VI secretion system Vgr protein OB-fold domain-containing protein n=1 Tax=Methylobacterium indicum TaxID=1775910 RepID=A0A8H8X0P3_9HYPH|nr:phage baseplate assembly protein V [Methylobacterium indicum]BCM87727.1 hypothetical protein mvi_61880 [Methylobacterium indicum]